MEFTLGPFGTYGSARMTDVKVHPWNKHAAKGALRMGKVALLQDYHLVPHMAVHKVHPEDCPDCCPSLVCHTYTVVVANHKCEHTRQIL